MALGIAGSAHVAPDGAHISVIGTAWLPAHNKVLYTIKMGEEVAPGFEGSAEEFLAFGVIEGDAYKAVAVSEMAEKGLDSLMAVGAGQAQATYGIDVEPGAHAPAVMAQNNVVEDTAGDEALMETQLRIANLFGEYFKLPMAACLATLRPSREVKKYAGMAEGLAQTCDVPPEWQADNTIMKPGHAYTGGYRDAEHAMALPRRMVKAEFGVPNAERTDGERTDGERMDSERMDSERTNGERTGDEQADGKMPSQQPAAPKKVPKMVKELSIDMVGFEHRNAELMHE